MTSKSECDQDIPKNNGNSCYSHVSFMGGLEEDQPVDNDYVTGKREFNINYLNDDCLLQIFSYFELEEKFKLEIVCKRWRIVLLDQWNSITHLDFNEQPKIPRITNSLLHKILQRCGMTLESLHLPTIYYSNNKWNWEMIGSLCRCLKDLRAGSAELKKEDAVHLTSYCKDLKSFRLESAYKVSYHFFDILIEKLLLESLAISIGEETYTRFLCNLPETLKNLELKRACEEHASNIRDGLYKAKNLEKLKLDECHPTTFSSLKSLPSKHNIKELSLRNHERSTIIFRAIDVNYISEFENLKKLFLERNNYVNDRLLNLISLNCKHLEVLDISGCNGMERRHSRDDETPVTDVGIKEITQITSLTSLNISKLREITDKSLTSIADLENLKTLTCQRCPNITTAGFSRLLSLCPDLELLDVRYNRRITSEIICMAKNIMIGRPNRKLHLIMSENQTREKEIPVTIKSLKVDVREEVSEHRVVECITYPHRFF